MLIADGQLEADLSDILVVGELSLDGGLRSTHGVLSFALLAKELGLKRIFVPKDNSLEAAVVEGVEVYPFENLTDVFQFLVGAFEVAPCPPAGLVMADGVCEYDFKDIKGQQQARRALEIAAAGSQKKNCVCMPGQISRYKKRISGPLIDRIDIHIDVPAVEVEKLTGNDISEDSKTIRKRVENARQTQIKRFSGSGVLTNGEMSNAHIKQFCQVTVEALELLKMAISQMNLSTPGYHRVLKLSRTIADLAESENILSEHIAEALTYRAREES